MCNVHGAYEIHHTLERLECSLTQFLQQPTFSVGAADRSIYYCFHLYLPTYFMLFLLIILTIVMAL